MNPVQKALARATEQLRDHSDTARLDSELLMAAAFNLSRDRLLLDPPSGSVPPEFEAMVKRRAEGEPVAYITGHRAFWTIDLEVGPGVLIPRPDSETLLVAALEHFDGGPEPKRVLDLGTGPGTLLLAALDQWPKSSGLGIDSSEAALEFARRNASRLGMERRAKFAIGNWTDDVEGAFDLILCNPPYVARNAELGPGVREFEPHEALFAGDDGLDDLRKLAQSIPHHIGKGGMAAIEIGHDQGDSAPALFANQGVDVRLAHDLAERPRAVILERPA